MIDRALDAITLSDIEDLVRFKRSEGRTLDFKATFPDAGHKGVRDFLADVTAFANSGGGDLVIGVTEDDNGDAAEVLGISRDNLDENLRRIEDQLRSCVDPRVPDFRIHRVDLPDGKVVLVLRVGASLIAPHRVTFDRSSRFYRRTNRANSDMSTAEIRQAFAASEDTPRKIRDLHRQALAAAEGADMPVRLRGEPAAILTIAPLSVLREARSLPVGRDDVVFPPRMTGAINTVVGLDSVIVHSPVDDGSGAVRTFSINHRRGYIDHAWTIGHEKDGTTYVWQDNFVVKIEEAARSTLARLRAHGIEGPWIVMATLIRIKGARLFLGDHQLSEPAWQDPAFLGEIIDDRLDKDALKPFVDGFWRVFGVDAAQ
ncbi:MAG: hypothetical protein C0520_00100 [Sphingopyxis sp.]|jgi:hypothetical protein|nr:hypothetical protein [Sphingopyxis sp.]